VNTLTDSERSLGDNSESPVTPSGCRFCGQPIDRMFLDLGMSPPCQNRIFPSQLNHMEMFYPLRVLLCEHCFLVQLQEYVAPDEIFSDYAYFSSYSSSWVEHAERYVEMVIERFSLGEGSSIVELASNDGYLLQHFVNRKVPCLGIEPADNVAEVARQKGIPTLSKFFGADVANEIRKEHGSADLIIGNNVLAHVPDLNGFVSGLKSLLSDHGVVTMEFPHLERLIAENQFDTIYHEHFSYLSFSVVEKVFARHGLRLFDVQELPTHGGSLRIFACHDDSTVHVSTICVSELRSREANNGFSETRLYDEFAGKVKATKRNILAFLIDQNNQGKQVVGYGAPGKGNTLLNYCGIREDLLQYTVDLSPHKQNTYTPGTHIPIYSPDRIKETKPDFIFILPWNLKDEISKQCQYVREWGGQFVVPIPEIQVF
jgi:SAM-dependent methyltransferase